MKVRDLLQRFIATAVTFLFFAMFKDGLGLVKTTDYLKLISILLLIYFGIVPFLEWLINILKRTFNKLVPKIGILNGYIEDAGREYKCVPKSTRTPGIIWDRELRKALKGIRLKRIKGLYAGKIDNSFALIINPYGENYPESDTDLRITFQKIRSYMKNGGIFFTSGAPFWYHQNTVTDRDGQWSVVKTQDGIQNMTDGLGYTKLGISVTMPIAEPLEPSPIEVYQRDTDREIVGDLLGEITEVKKYRAVLPNTPDCLPFLREKEDSTYPLCAIQYDKGFLLHSGMWLEDQTSSEFQILVRALATLINKRLRPFG
jgi:hypothetical protein